MDGQHQLVGAGEGPHTKSNVQHPKAHRERRPAVLPSTWKLRLLSQFWRQKISALCLSSHNDRANRHNVVAIKTVRLFARAISLFLQAGRALCQSAQEEELCLPRY